MVEDEGVENVDDDGEDEVLDELLGLLLVDELELVADGVNIDVELMVGEVLEAVNTGLEP